MINIMPLLIFPILLIFDIHIKYHKFQYLKSLSFLGCLIQDRADCCNYRLSMTVLRQV